MDEIIKQTIIQIAAACYIAGKSGMTGDAFQMFLKESIRLAEEKAEAEEVKSLDPNYAIN